MGHLGSPSCTDTSYTDTSPLMLNSERQYVDLLFRVSKKYASWDPEIVVEVGDWGRITDGRTGYAFWRRGRGIFLKEGNIYQDGKAEKYRIPRPTEYGLGADEAVSWVVSENAEACDVDIAAGGLTPIFAQCTPKAGFRFSTGYGAVLAMEMETVSAINPPGSLRRLLKDETMRNCVVVSEVHRCSSFARLLTARRGGTVAIGLKVQPPVSGVVSVTAEATWMRSSSAGNFKSRVNKRGSRDFYPLFRLVSLKEKDVSVGFRGGQVEDDEDLPLPDAAPPWLLTDCDGHTRDKNQQSITQTTTGEEITAKPVVGTFTFTALRASGVTGRRCSFFYPRTYVTVKVGNQVRRTRVTGLLGSYVWDETLYFTLAEQGCNEVEISLYQASLFRDVLIGSVTKDLLEFEPWGKEVTVPVTDAGEGSVKITCRRGEVVFSGARCRMFALIIGIDQYISPAIPSLRGCVNDAKAIKAFLVDNFHIPDSQIVFLANESATRSAIISNFSSHLIHNAQIQEDDAIVIFYAGHGSRVKAPKEWSLDDTDVEMICPHDERTNDVNGEYVHGIPDRTINALLRKLSTLKGNNITVILDSCHSGGIARQSSSLTARFVPTTRPIPAVLDAAIWAPDAGFSVFESIPTGVTHKFMDSHVLLAACRPEQSAHESTSDDRLFGFFTNSLIQQLRRTTLDQITYSELIETLPQLINQSPHCEGANKNRTLFCGIAVAKNQHTFMLAEKGNGTFEIKAGSMHGVVVGTEFAITDKAIASPSTGDLCILVAVSVNSTSSMLALRPSDEKNIIPNKARVSVFNWKNDRRTLKVFVEPGSMDRLAVVLSRQDNALPVQSGLPSPNHSRSFVQVESRSKASVAIEFNSKGELVIERLDTLISAYARRTISLNPRTRLERLPDVLDALANFNFHLGRQRGCDMLKGKVIMELYRLTGPFGYRTPDMKIGNLLLAGNHATVALDEDAKYGVAIVNHSSHDLYPYLFYFDPLSYSIEAWYLPPTMLAPLPAQRGPDPTAITVGYGAGGGYAFEFFLPPGQSSDTGFLKLFVSAKPVSLELITQDSPLEETSVPRAGRKEMLDSGIWDAWVAAVTVIDGTLASLCYGKILEASGASTSPADHMTIIIATLQFASQKCAHPGFRLNNLPFHIPLD